MEPSPRRPPSERADAPADLKSLLRQKRALSEVKLTHPDASVPRHPRPRAAHWRTASRSSTSRPAGRARSTERSSCATRSSGGERRATCRCASALSTSTASKSWPVTQGALVEVEADLAHVRGTHGAADRPPGPRKARHWLSHVSRASALQPLVGPFGEDSAVVDGRGDVELVVTAKAGEHGFLARSSSRCGDRGRVRRGGGQAASRSSRRTGCCVSSTACGRRSVRSSRSRRGPRCSSLSGTPRRKLPFRYLTLLALRKGLRKLPIIQSHPPESNRRPTDYESVALPTELGWHRRRDSLTPRAPAEGGTYTSPYSPARDEPSPTLRGGRSPERAGSRAAIPSPVRVRRTSP